MGFDGPLDDGESEARAFHLGLGVVLFDPVESFEDEGEITAGDPNAIIGDANCEVPFFVLFSINADGDGSSGVLLESILDEVEENLGPIEMVTGDLNPGNVHFNGRLLLFDDGFQSLDDVTDTPCDIEWGKFEGSCFIRLQFGDHEHVFDDAIDADDMPVHGVEHLLSESLVIESAFFGEVFEISRNDGKRGPEFVRSICDEILADLVGVNAGGDIAHHELNFQGVALKGEGADIDFPMGVFITSSG